MPKMRYIVDPIRRRRTWGVVYPVPMVFPGHAVHKPFVSGQALWFKTHSNVNK